MPKWSEERKRNHKEAMRQAKLKRQEVNKYVDGLNEENDVEKYPPSNDYSANIEAQHEIQPIYYEINYYYFDKLLTSKHATYKMMVHQLLFYIQQEGFVAIDVTFDGRVIFDHTKFLDIYKKFLKFGEVDKLVTHLFGDTEIKDETN